MNFNKGLIIFDLDGTVFTDFLERDKVAIKDIFNDNKIVRFIDLIARNINSLGIVKNTTAMLKLRLFVYSLFSFTNFKRAQVKYRAWYIKEAIKSIRKNSYLLKMLTNKGYDIIILSNNIYSEKLDTKYNIITGESKLLQLKKLHDKYDGNIKFYVGDNYFDDIVNAHIVGIKPLYIGNSLFLKKSGKVECSFKTLKDVINYIIENLK